MKDQTAKADGGKSRPSLLQKDFALALRTIQAVFDYGEQKYSHLSWRGVENERWDDAQRRHQQEIDLSGYSLNTDHESNLLHRSHQIAGLIVMLQRDLEEAALAGARVSAYFEFNPPPQDHKKGIPNAFCSQCTPGSDCGGGTRCLLRDHEARPDVEYRGPTGE